MFAYCLNNPVSCMDYSGQKATSSTEEETESGPYRFVGLGVQGELSVGSYEVGFEIIVYWDDVVCGNEDPKVAVYIYEGAFVDIDDMKKSTQFTKTIEKLILAISTNVIDEQNAEVLLIALQQALFQDIGISGSVICIWGNNYFDSTESYCGAFDTYSATIKHVKFTYSSSPSCKVVGIGASTSKYDLSFGQSYYTQIY